MHFSRKKLTIIIINMPYFSKFLRIKKLLEKLLILTLSKEFFFIDLWKALKKLARLNLLTRLTR